MHHEGILLRVTNRGWSDVIVYLQEGGVPRRLGKVPSQGRALLGIPAVFMTGMPLRLLLRAGGRAGTYAAEGVSARPGQIIELYVPPMLGMSSVVVW